MHDHKYLIIGGGMTADAAVSGIREIDQGGRIGLISSDTDPPYDRPPLTKGLWKGKPLNSIWRHTADRKVDLYLGRTANGLDLEHKRVADDRKEVFSFEKLLLATGGSPRVLPFGQDDIIYYRNLKDYRRVRELTTKAKRLAVIGSGFIGSELAAALAMNQKQVVMVFPGASIGQRMFPSDLSQFVTDFYRNKGVEILNGESAVALERRGAELLLKMKSGRQVTVDAVVAGIGIQPNLELATAAGLKTADGIVVDEYLRTSHAEVYAAGDVALFYSPELDRHLRVEHEDNANTMGRIAGRNMAGAAEPYTHLPFFYSDLFELGYEAVGEIDSRLNMLSDWKTPHRDGVVYYQKDGLVRGVLLWNVWEQVEAARELIVAKRRFEFAELKHKLPKAA